MLNIYNTDLKTNKFEKIKEFRPGSWISLVNPSEEEIKKQSLKLKRKRLIRLKKKKMISFLLIMKL